MSEARSEFQCVLCAAHLKSKEELQEHFRQHANKKIDDKGQRKKFSKQSSPCSVPSDGKRELKIETVPCDICSMIFNNVTAAIQHKFKKHPDSISKHFCGYCGMQFPLKAMRDKHLDQHEGMEKDGSFKCTECGIEFYTQRGLLYHDKSTHKRVSKIFQPVATPPPSKKIRINNANEAQSVYYCYLCGSEYIIKFNLQKHLEKAHTERERTDAPSDYIRCTVCEALFYNKKAYDNHNLFHKPDDLYVTSEEQRLQTVSRVDQDFDIRRVQLPTEKFIPVHKNARRKVTSTQVKNKWIKKEKSKSEDELSPVTDPETSDSESEKSTKNQKAAANINKEAPVVVKKRIYAIVNPDGTIQKTCTDIPKNAKLAKTDTIKIKNSDILKTLVATNKLTKIVGKKLKQNPTQNETADEISQMRNDDKITRDETKERKERKVDESETAKDPSTFDKNTPTSEANDESLNERSKKIEKQNKEKQSFVEQKSVKKFKSFRSSEKYPTDKRDLKDTAKQILQKM